MLRSDAVYKCYAALDSALSRPQPKRAKKGTDAFSVKRLENASVPFLPAWFSPRSFSASPRLRVKYTLSFGSQCPPLGGTSHGRRITFIRFASCRYSRSNHDAPSASGATALISGSTWIAPRDIISIHAGYSPFEAHDPCTRICRDTTDCSGSSISGDTFQIGRAH